MSRITRSLALLTTVLLLVVAGCSDGGSSDDRPTWDALPEVERQAPKVQQRDQDAVLAALARLDPCSLVDPAKARAPGFAADLPTSQQAPHECSVERPGDTYELTVTSGVELPASERYARTRMDLAGAVAYRLNDVGEGLCFVSLPVSDTHAIEFTGDNAGVGCRTVTAFAKVAARRLLNEPDMLLRGPGLERRAVCDLFAPAVGTLPRNRLLRTGTDVLSGLDQCGLWKGNGQVLRLGHTGRGPDPHHPDAFLQLEYGEPSRQHYAGHPGDFLALAGTDAFVQREDSQLGCRVGWDAWTAESPHTDAGDVARAEIEAKTCDRARKLARKVMTTIDQPAASHPTVPRLPYRPTEPDTGVPGACADVPPAAATHCAPYADDDVEVPDDPVDLIRHAESDPMVTCAATTEAVRATYGDELVPVALSGSKSVLLRDEISPETTPDCLYVEPTHQVLVWVRLSSEAMDSTAAAMADFPERKIADHPARAGQAENLQERWVALDRADDRGLLHLTVMTQQHRRTGMDPDAKVDRAPLSKIDQLAEALTEEHLA